MIKYHCLALQHSHGNVEQAVDILIVQSSLDDREYPEETASQRGGHKGGDSNLSAEMDRLTLTVLSRSNSLSRPAGTSTAALEPAALSHEMSPSSQSTASGAAMTQVGSFAAALQGSTSAVTCRVCTFVNPGKRTSHCEMCGSELRSASSATGSNRKAARSARKKQTVVESSLGLSGVGQRTPPLSTTPRASLREIMDVEMAQHLSLQQSAAATRAQQAAASAASSVNDYYTTSNNSYPLSSSGVDWTAMAREVGTGSTSENRWQVMVISALKLSVIASRCCADCAVCYPFCQH